MILFLANEKMEESPPLSNIQIWFKHHNSPPKKATLTLWINIIIHVVSWEDQWNAHGVFFLSPFSNLPGKKQWTYYTSTSYLAYSQKPDFLRWVPRIEQIQMVNFWFTHQS